MHFDLTATSRHRLSTTALHVPSIVELDGEREIALAMRVSEIFSSRRPFQPFALNCLGYQAKEGMWVVVLAFRLGTKPERCLSGRVYLDPLQDAEFALVQHLAIQERLVFIFWNETLSGAVGHERAWSMEERYRARLLLGQVVL